MVQRVAVTSIAPDLRFGLAGGFASADGLTVAWRAGPAGERAAAGVAGRA